MVSPLQCHLQLAIYVFRRKEHKNTDRFEAHWEEMLPVTGAKRIALLPYKQNPCHSTLDTLKAAKSKAQRTARPYAEYWQSVYAKIQTAAHCSHAREMYEGIKDSHLPHKHQDSTSQSKVWRSHHGPVQAAKALGWALSRASLNRCCPWRLARTTSHGGARRDAYTGGA